MPADRQAIATKLAAARTRLILDKPFLGALVLRLPLQPANPEWCPTTATDARAFYYNPEYIGGLSMEQTQFILAHEALHCALSHFARRQHRMKHRWDLACDHAVNPLLLDDGLTPPPGAHWQIAYKGMTAEEIYPLLDEDDQSQPLDKHVYDADNQGSQADRGMREGDLDQSPRDRPPPGDERGPGARPETRAEGEGAGEAAPQDGEEQGAAQPQPLTPDEQETLSVQWQQRLAGAAQQALQAGKLKGEMARLIDHLLAPQLPWRALLARHMYSTAREDYSYSRPSRREGTFILPSLRSHQIDMIVAVDTSGSIRPPEMEAFITEVEALKGQVRARVTLHLCDAALCPGGPWVYEPWEALAAPQDIRGGGGTSFVPVFDWVERSGMRPDLLVYFTDAEGEFPRIAPPYPVVWLVKGRLKVPFGERIQLN